MLKKGAEMESLIFIFIACIVAMFAAVYVYSKKEDTAYHETKVELLKVQATLKSAQDSLNQQRTLVVNQNLKIKEFEEKLVCASDELKKFKVEIDNLQEHCARIREQQIQLKDQLANKRPVLKVTTPIPVQIQSITTPKPDPKMVKRIQKQLDGLSK
jgi:septal ring factor EnvC (AmiA/AmiB activator)